jgi:hypothetical protein
MAFQWLGLQIFSALNVRSSDARLLLDRQGQFPFFQANNEAFENSSPLLASLSHHGWAESGSLDSTVATCHLTLIGNLVGFCSPETGFGHGECDEVYYPA